MMDIDDQLDSLHLTEPRDKKRRRLSGVLKRKDPHKTSSSNDSDSSESPEPRNMPTLEEENEPLNDFNEKPVVRRSGRKTSAPVRWDAQNSLSNTNTVNSDNLAAIEKYYLDRTIKKTTRALETIFEEVQEKKANLHNVMSVRKLRRSINFSETLNKVHPGKIRKRKTKASKLNGKKRLGIKSSLDDLFQKLSSIDQD